MPKQIIDVPSAPTVGATPGQSDSPVAQAIRFGAMLFVSGQGAVDHHGVPGRHRRREGVHHQQEPHDPSGYFGPRGRPSGLGTPVPRGNNKSRMNVIVCVKQIPDPATPGALDSATNTLKRDGKLILDDQYYTFSSIVFYAEKYHGDRLLLLNGRVNNLEYGSYAPGAENVFLDDAGFAKLWQTEDRYYIAIERPQLERLQKLSGGKLFQVVESGGKYVYSNQAVM